MLKQCKRCNKHKEATTDYFPRNRASKDGFFARCKQCLSEAAANHCNPIYSATIVSLSTEQIIYLAGLIDGEGWIGIRKSKETPKGRYCAAISIGMCTDVIFDLQKEYDIGYANKRKAIKKGWKQCVCWVLPPNDCRGLLPLIIPYLRVKCKQAELVLRYLTLAQHHSRKQSYRDEVESIYQQLRVLNRKGTPK